MNKLLQQLPNYSVGKNGKPYLRPLTDMTEEELRTFRIYFNKR